MKAIEHYFHVVLFITLYKVILTFESVDKTLVCDHSKESYWAVISCGTVGYTEQSYFFCFLQQTVYDSFLNFELSRFDDLLWKEKSLAITLLHVRNLWYLFSLSKLELSIQTLISDILGYRSYQQQTEVTRIIF